MHRAVKKGTFHGRISEMSGEFNASWASRSNELAYDPQFV